MSKTLIIAEKPSVASNIAHVLGANDRKDGYFEGNGYYVSFAFGHLLTLCDAKDYDEKYAKWELENYPFIPNEFKFKVIDDKGVKKQFNILKELIEKSDLVINACDSDREGEAIFYSIFSNIGIDRPVKRLWISSHTPADIKKGMKNLKDNSEMVYLQAAGYCRTILDWLIGINFTSVATLKYGNGELLNIGRVLIPTLYLIYERYKERNDFKPKDIFELNIEFENNGNKYVGTYTDGEYNKFENMSVLSDLKTKINNKDGIVSDKKVEISKKGPGKLFNLTDLQGHITSKYNGFSADKVLKIAQKLYENKYITYPRTSSRYLDDTQVNDMKRVFDSITKDIDVPGLSFNEKSSIFNSSKVDSHPALTPTYIVPTNLKEDEFIVYNEIKLRFLSQFMPLAEYENTTIITTIDNFNFITKGKVLINEGYLSLYDDFKNNDALLPNVDINSTSSLVDSHIRKSKTQPPKKYTENSLLKAMENCGKNVSDDDIEHILEGFSIGTAATRAETIKKLESVGYVNIKGKTIDITKLGISLIETLPAPKLKDVNFTGMLEKKLKDIEKGIADSYKFLDFIKKYVIKITNEIKGSDGSVDLSSSFLGKCPECGSDIKESDKVFFCTGYKKNDCKFAIWKNDKFLNKFGVKVNKSFVKKVLSDKDILIKGLKNKEGKKFDALLTFEKNDKGYYNFGFSFDFEREVIGKCPECISNVFEGDNNFYCSNKECKFVLFKNDKFLERYKKKLTKTMAKNLLKNVDSSFKVKGFYSVKKDKKFDANIKLKKNGQYWNIVFDF